MLQHGLACEDLILLPGVFALDTQYYPSISRQLPHMSRSLYRVAASAQPNTVLSAGACVTLLLLCCSFWTGAVALHMLWPVSGLVWLSLVHIFSLLHQDQDIECQVARRELAMMQASCLARTCSGSLLGFPGQAALHAWFLKWLHSARQHGPPGDAYHHVPCCRFLWPAVRTDPCVWLQRASLHQTSSCRSVTMNISFAAGI